MANHFNMEKRLMAAALWAIVSLFIGTVVAQTTLVSYKFKFGLASNPTPAGYIRVSPKNLYVQADTTIAGYYGFENWKHCRLGAVDRGGSDTLHRDFITNFDSAKTGVFYHNSPFYFSVNVPEGKYRAKVTMGDPNDTAITTIKGESRRLLLKDFKTLPGQYITQIFSLIRRAPAIKGSTRSVALDFTNGREDPAICLDWDEKLTLEFNGRRPCISAVEIYQVPDTTGITIHLAGNSTMVEQENEPWTAWGQNLLAFVDTNVFVNNLGSSGLTSSSFISELRLAKICSMMNKGDYLVFEFGHNDSKATGYQTAFVANMTTFYDSAQKHSATMVFITPTARSGDTDSSASIGGAAQLTRTTAATLTGSKLIDLNSAVIHINAATANDIYCHVSADSLWPDQPAVSDGTHLCDYGGYTLAKWIAYQGMRAAALPVRANLYDTAAMFNSSQPLNPAVTTNPDTFATWHLACSLDTIYRHTAATICSTIVTPTGVKQASAVPASIPGYAVSVNALSGTITYSALEAEKAKFIVYSLTGKKLIEKSAVVTASQNSMQWEELGRLPQGTYFLEMEVNNRNRAKTSFQKM